MKLIELRGLKKNEQNQPNSSGGDRPAVKSLSLVCKHTIRKGYSTVYWIICRANVKTKQKIKNKISRSKLTIKIIEDL